MNVDVEGLGSFSPLLVRASGVQIRKFYVPGTTTFVSHNMV
jgi:hypothetical protein